MARPRLSDDVARRHTINTRTTKAVFDAVRAAAFASGRSIAHEVELRLEQSFREDAMRQIVREELQRVEEERMRRQRGELVDPSYCVPGRIDVGPIDWSKVRVT